MHPTTLAILAQARHQLAPELTQDLAQALARFAPAAHDEWQARITGPGRGRVTPAQAMVLVLLRRDWESQPEGTQERDDAQNALTEALSEAMVEQVRFRWDSWCLKATTQEIVTEALCILGLLTEAEAHDWPFAYSQLGSRNHPRLGTSHE